MLVTIAKKMKGISILAVESFISTELLLKMVRY